VALNKLWRKTIRKISATLYCQKSQDPKWSIRFNVCTAMIFHIVISWATPQRSLAGGCRRFRRKMLSPSSGWKNNLNMEAAGSSERFSPVYQTTRRHIPQCPNLGTHRHQKLTSLTHISFSSSPYVFPHISLCPQVSAPKQVSRISWNTNLYAGPLLVYFNS
jgi:hypothetical protein